MPSVPPPLDTDASPGPARQGLATGISAYLIWGFAPLWFAGLRHVGPLEILANRVVWSLVAVALVLMLLRRPWGWLRTLADGRHLARLVGATLLVATNWLVFIWAATNDRVVQASLGYFINPLVNVALGVALFGERMGRSARLGTLLAAAGVVVIGWGNGRDLWVSLVLAASFGLYGAVKKKAQLPALEGLFVESALLLPLAVGYLGWLAALGRSAWGSEVNTSLLLMLAGTLTALPLWLFSVAATRLPYGVLGILQYLAPTIQFVLGITVFGQVVGPSYWAGLALVWAGSAAYLVGAFRRAR